jgi:hypothetical protein
MSCVYQLFSIFFRFHSRFFQTSIFFFFLNPIFFKRRRQQQKKYSPVWNLACVCICMNAFTCVCGQSSITEYFCRVSDLFLCLCVCVCVCLFFLPGMIERARTREGYEKNVFFFLSSHLNIFISSLPPKFSCCALVRSCDCVCVCGFESTLHSY